MPKENLPVYLFTGFLEAGKTHFLNETLADPSFHAGERTLILLCEEGEEEIAPAKNIFIETISDPEDLTKAKLSSIERSHNVERVMIEYNGMWPLDLLYAALPDRWEVFQEVMIADGRTFLDYNTNLRQQTFDKLSSADPVIFNRLPKNFDKETFHKIVRVASRSCNIIYEYDDHTIESDDIEDPLPFDKTAEVIEIADSDFAYFFRDLSEDMAFYNGKKISFVGIVARDKRFPKGLCAVGRELMVCCPADISYRAFALEGAPETDPANGSWIRVTGKITVKNCPLYRGKGPVLSLLHWEPAPAPDPALATF